MKKLTLSGIIAASVLMMTACSEDNTFGQQPSAEGNVTFNVTLPSGLGSRAFADGYSATTLQYAVYESSSDATADGNFISEGSASFDADKLTTTVSLQLANGKAYKIAFFAHNGTDAYDFNAQAKTVTVDYTKMTAYNSTDYDCFYGTYTTPVVTGPISDNVTINRPVAQINWGTSDLAIYNNAYGDAAASLTTKVDVKGVNNVLNLFDGSRSGEADVTFPALAAPDGESFPVEPAKYAYLSMNYVLVPAESSIVEATLTPNNGSADMTAVVVANMPVQANYRTNVYGALLTNPADFTVTKEENFGGDDNNIEFDGENFRVANTLAEAQDLLEAGQAKVAIDGAKVTTITRANDAVVFNLNKAVASQALKIYGKSASPVKIAYAELSEGSTEASDRQFELIVTGDLSGAEFDLPEASVKLEGRSEGEEKVAVDNVTITNAASAAVTGEVAVETIEKGENVDADVEFEGAIELTVAEAAEFVKAINNPAIDKINVPATANIDLSAEGELKIAHNITICVDGSINTARAQIGITGEGNIMTVLGSGTITSKGLADTTGNRPLNSYDGATLVVRNITVETEQNNGGSSIFSEDGNIDLEKVTINSHHFAIGANGGNLKIKDCIIYSDSNNREGAFSYTVSVGTGCKAVIENTQITGIQGALTVQGEGSECIVKSGTYKTVNHETYGAIAFYAVYATDKGVAIIEGGDFSSPTDRSANKIAEGTSALVAGDNDVNMPDGNFIIKGGRFSGKAYNTTTKVLCSLPEGYEYQELTDAGDLKWTVVKKQ